MKAKVITIIAVLLCFVMMTTNFLLIRTQHVSAIPEEELPDFELVDWELKTIRPGLVKLTMTITNVGESATTGIVTISWERAMYDLLLENGHGVLRESDVGLDLNGDNDRVDQFEVKWVEDTRDAYVDGVLVHAIRETDKTSYYIDGERKLFKLGTKEHCLYYADSTLASFGLVARYVEHSSPNIELVFVHSFTPFRKGSYIRAYSFRLNELSARAKFQATMYSYELWEPRCAWWLYRAYIIPTGEIESEKVISFSCTISGKSGDAYSLYCIVNWSPDGNIRYRWIPLITDFTL